MSVFFNNEPGSLAGTVALPLAIFFAVTVEMAPAGSIHHIAGEFGAALPEAAVGSALYAVATALLALPMAILLRSTSLRRAFLVASTAFALMALCSALAPDILVYTGMRVANGIVHAAFFPLALALAARSAHDHPERAVARALLGNALALAIGVPLGEAIGALASWRIPMAVAAAGVLLSALFAPTEWKKAENSDGNSSLVKTRCDLVAIGVVFAVIIAGHFAFYAYFAPLLDWSGLPASVYLAIYGASVVLATLVSGTLAGHARLEKALAIVCLEAVILVAAGTAGTNVALAVLAVGTGLCIGLLPTLLQSELLEIEDGNGAIASGIAVVAFNSGIAAGTFAGGLAEPFSRLYPSLLGSALLAAAAIGLAGLVLKRRSRNPAPSPAAGR